MICRSLWHSTLKNTKTEEDVDETVLVPIIKPLRLLLDAIKPAHVSGFISQHHWPGLRVGNHAALQRGSIALLNK